MPLFTKMFCCLSMATSAIAFTVPSYGQQADSVDLFDLSLEDLMNLSVVSSTKKSERMVETPAAVSVITAEEIRLLNFNTLQQVLEYATGVASINGEGGFFNTTTIRGNTLVNYNTNTLLLFDGVPIYNAYNGSFDFSAVPVSSIDKVEIVKGANSVLYGTNAINGVINIISKETNADTPVIGSGKVRYGTNRTLYTNAAYGKKTDELKFHIFADALSSQGQVLTYQGERGEMLRLQRTYKGLNMVSNVVYRGWKLHLQYYNRQEPAVRTRGFRRAYISVDDSVGRSKPEVNDENAFVANLDYWHAFSDRTKLHLRSSMMQWTNYKDMVDGYWDYSSWGSYNDAELHFDLLNGRSSNIAGVSFNRYIGRRYKSQVGDYGIGKSNTKTNDYAVYLNGSYALTNPLKIHYGARYYRSAYDTVSLDNFSPRLAVTYALTKNVYLKGIYGQSFRVPTYFEKEAAAKRLIGNPNLSPEQSSSVDLIASGTYRMIQADINFFYTQTYNRIRRTVAPEDPSLFKHLNVGQVAFRGVEFNTKFRIKEKLNGFLGYSHVVGWDQKTGEDLPFVFNHMANAGAIYHVSSQVSLTGSAKYMDRWGKAPAYTVLNTGLNVQPKKDTPFFVEFKADNIFDTHVLLPEIARNKEAVPTIPTGRGREFFMGLQYRF